MCTNCDRGAALFYPELFQEYVKLSDEQQNEFPSYQSIDGKESFTLLPNTQINDDMGGILPNPDTRHYLTYDVYTHITSLPKQISDSIDWKNVKEFIF